jgi:5-methyltetrahydrofolate--homocysteine methyltransferase
VLTTLGVSNVSFGLQKHARAVLNSVFLTTAWRPGSTPRSSTRRTSALREIDEEERKLANDLIFDRRTEEHDPLAAFIATTRGGHEESSDRRPDRRDGAGGRAALEDPAPQERRAGRALVDQGAGEVERNGAVPVLNEVLLPAMKEVGDKFGAGELILPFVLQSAEVMKKAVARLETYLEKAEGQTKGKVVLATVYGDVHDIGKNLVNTILTNNGYTVFDLGKQVPVNTIIEKARRSARTRSGSRRCSSPPPSRCRSARRSCTGAGCATRCWSAARRSTRASCAPPRWSRMPATPYPPGCSTARTPSRGWR